MFKSPECTIMCAAFSHPIEEKVIAEYKADDGKKHGQKINRTGALANTMDMLVPIFQKRSTANLSKHLTKSFTKHVK